MADTSKIEWTEATWNPTVGCTHVSAGCDNCYAAGLASGRLSGTPTYAGLANGGKFNGTVRLLPERLGQPLRWHKPRRVFVNSMSDLFHESVPDGFIAQVWDVMGQTPQHTYQILTKRHGRMRSWVTRWADRTGDDAVAGSGGLPPMPRGPGAVRAIYRSGRAGLFADMLESMGEPPEGYAYPTYDWMEGQRWWPSVLPNVWLGVSVEDQKWADIRIPALLDTPAAVRFLSCEPLLGPIDLSAWITDQKWPSCWDDHSPTAECGQCIRPSWVIVGGESGRRARPMHPDWARSLRDQCADAGVAFFFKQFGEWAPTGRVGIGNTEPARVRLVGQPDERGFREEIRRVGKKIAGRELDGREWSEYPGGRQ